MDSSINPIDLIAALVRQRFIVEIEAGYMVTIRTVNSDLCYVASGDTIEIALMGAISQLYQEAASIADVWKVYCKAEEAANARD